VEEINRAIVQMESVTQQNAALVEQATAATLAFEEEAKRLNESVSRFKLAETARPAALRAAPVAAAAFPGGASALQRTPSHERARPALPARGPHDRNRKS
jgi:methyl-accepting chemotaxis protein